MRFLAVLPITVLLAFAGITGANAAPAADAAFVDSADAHMHLDANGDPYHHCHGRSSGTASAACGTLTGGPVGGLF